MKPATGLGIPWGDTPLHMVARLGLATLVKELLEAEVSAGVDVDCRNKEGDTPLILACMGGHLQVATLLLEHGDRTANITLTDALGLTALAKAASAGHTEVVDLLLKHGADVHARDGFGATPLLWAAHRGHLEVVRLLLDGGADPNAACRMGIRALHWAVYMGQMSIVQLLLERGADVNATCDPQERTGGGQVPPLPQH